MGRAERRREAKEQTKDVATYTLTRTQIEDMKTKATKEAVTQAFTLMLGLPVMVVRDSFNKFYKKENRLENFVDEVLDLYDRFDAGALDLVDVLNTLKKDTGIDIMKMSKKKR